MEPQTQKFSSVEVQGHLPLLLDIGLSIDICDELKVA